MKFGILLCLVLATCFAAEETCTGRCQSGFDPTKKCQCDRMCKYYGSCCEDFDSACRTKSKNLINVHSNSNKCQPFNDAFLYTHFIKLIYSIFNVSFVPTGEQYYQYEFKHQPSHGECDRMTKSSPSVAFTRYTNLYCDLDNVFALLFQGIQGHHKGPRFISKDWIGIKPPIDAAMVGRLYVSPGPSPSPATSLSRGRTRQRKKTRGRGARVSRSLFWEDFGLDYEERCIDYMSKCVYDPDDYIDHVEIVQEKATPVQNVFFFKKDKYYRVDLQTKRIDYVNPPYPRSIGKYWLGCKEKDLSEKR
uniref:Vitronectin b n=1 Tax=Sinocyclocheilus grahami TaxID=75366 RepID=A0A672T2F9_SINGR